MKSTTQFGILGTVIAGIVGVITGVPAAFYVAGIIAIFTVLDYVFSAPELAEAVAPAPAPAPAAPVQEAKQEVKVAPAKKTAAKKTVAKKAPAAKKTPAKKTTVAKKTAKK